MLKAAKLRKYPARSIVYRPWLRLVSSPKVASAEVLLGIGMATLVAPKDGRPCVYVKGLAKGVRVAGLMLQAEQRISCSRTMSNIHPKQDIVEVSAHVSHFSRSGGCFQVDFKGGVPWQRHSDRSDRSDRSQGH